MHPHHVSYGGPIHPHAVHLHQPPHPHLQMYLQPPQFQYPPHTTNQQFTNNQPPAYANIQPNQQATFASAPVSQYQLPPPTPANFVPAQSTGYSNMAPNPNGSIQPNIQYYGAAVTIAQQNNIRTATVAAGHIYPVAIQPGNAPQQAVIRPQPHRQPQQFSQIQLRYLLAAYRVGMLAMETLARRVHDDRPQAKYARNPPYGEDVKWLLRISKNLGMLLDY